MVAVRTNQETVGRNWVIHVSIPIILIRRPIAATVIIAWRTATLKIICPVSMRTGILWMDTYILIGTDKNIVWFGFIDATNIYNEQNLATKRGYKSTMSKYYSFIIVSFCFDSVYIQNMVHFIGNITYLFGIYMTIFLTTVPVTFKFPNIFGISRFFSRYFLFRVKTKLMTTRAEQIKRKMYLCNWDSHR